MVHGASDSVRNDAGAVIIKTQRNRRSGRNIYRRETAHRPASNKPGERPKDRPSPVANKAAVVSVLGRGGRVHSRHVERVTAENLKPIIQGMVDKSAHLMTDTSTVLESAGHGLMARSGEP
jgi:hypothetical protein